MRDRPNKGINGMSKRKAFSPYKQRQRVAKHVIRNLMVAYSTWLDGCVLFDQKSQCLIHPTDSIVAGFQYRYKWSLLIAIFGRNQLGDEYMKSEIITANEPCTQSQLAPLAWEYHQQLLKEFPRHHLIGVGWLADPFGADISEQEAGDIFTGLGVWDATTTADEVMKQINKEAA